MLYTNIHTRMQTHTTKLRVSVLNQAVKMGDWKKGHATETKWELAENRIGFLWMSHSMLCFFCLEPGSIHLLNCVFRWTNSHQTPTNIICLKPYLSINSHTGGTFKPGYHRTTHLWLLANTQNHCSVFLVAHTVHLILSSSIRWTSNFWD